MKDVHAPKREIGGIPLRWGSPDGLVHAVEGDQMVPNNPDTFLLWAICGKHDVPANAGVRSRAKVTCPDCAMILAQEAR
jgi:hypothetical protein